jgi:hypothetical protein
VPDIMGGTSSCLSVLVLDPSLVESVAVWGPCDLTVGGECHRVSHVFCGHHRARISRVVGTLYWETSSRHLMDVREDILGGCSKLEDFEMSILNVLFFFLIGY